ncbi:MAG: hypothetical protein ACW963_08615, partial [Candidatus Sifarchaeia archaeon]
MTVQTRYEYNIKGVRLSLKMKNPQTSFLKILSLSLVFLGLGVVTYLVQQRTNITPRARSPITPPGQIRSDHYLDKNSSVRFITTNTDYQLHVLLKRKNGKVETNQGNLDYQWSNVYPDEFNLSMTPKAECTNKIKSPCPEDHLIIRAPTISSHSSTTIKVTVVDKTSGAEI